MDFFRNVMIDNSMLAYVQQLFSHWLILAFIQQVVSAISTLAESWPVKDSISGSKESLRVVTQQLSEQHKSFEQKYNHQVIQYW